MDQQIRDNKDRIIFFFTDTYLNCCAIFLCNHSMKGKWKCHPLIFLDSTIIMCIKISKLFIFIQRILLYVNTRGINVSSKNIHTFCQRFCTHMEQRNRLVHTHGIQFISGFHFFSIFNDISDILISFCFCLFNCQCNTLALCLSGIKAVLVFCIHLFQSVQLFLTVSCPCIFSVHVILLLFYLPCYFKVIKKQPKLNPQAYL